MWDWITFGAGTVAGVVIDAAIGWFGRKYAPQITAAETAVKTDWGKIEALASGTSAAIKTVRAEAAAKVSSLEAAVDKRVSALETQVFGQSHSPTPAASSGGTKAAPAPVQQGAPANTAATLGLAAVAGAVTGLGT